MYQYFALSWNSQDPSRTAESHRLARQLTSASSRWKSVLETPGLAVFHAPKAGSSYDAYSLENSAGVILGRLFRKNGDEYADPNVPNLDAGESERLIRSMGRRLTEDYWGHYVAFLREPDSHRRFVIRDPTGGLPCYHTRIAGVDVFASDVEDCVRLSPTSFAVDWEHIAAFFVHTRLVTRSTGILGTTRLLAGECVVVDDSGAPGRSFYWHPADVCTAETIEDAKQARSALRSVVRRCVNAWASRYGSIVHELSGGLDSSVVARCLSDTGVLKNFLCFHYYTEASEGDERSYAREVARTIGLELIESEVRAADKPLQQMLEPSRVASPAMLGLLSTTELLKRRLVSERRAGAVFSGQGGDQLFFESRSKLIAAEYAHRHGVKPELFKVSREVSRLTHESIWSICRTVMRYGLLRRPFDLYASLFDSTSLLTDEARSSISLQSYSHPWVGSTDRLPPSKIEHIFDVIDCEPFNGRLYSYADRIHPLISQPVVECCLKIPTYVLNRHGRARGLLREAFSADLPAKVVERRVKGGTTSYFNRLLVENAVYLRELLLDGALVRERILDRRALERCLSESRLIRGEDRRSIFTSVVAETWLSNWMNTKDRAACQ